MAAAGLELAGEFQQHEAKIAGVPCLWIWRAELLPVINPATEDVIGAQPACRHHQLRELEKPTLPDPTRLS